MLSPISETPVRMPSRLLPPAPPAGARLGCETLYVLCRWAGAADLCSAGIALITLMIGKRRMAAEARDRVMAACGPK